MEQIASSLDDVDLTMRVSTSGKPHRCRYRVCFPPQRCIEQLKELRDEPVADIRL